MMLFDDAPERDEMVLLRTAQNFMKKPLCPAIRNKCLKGFSSLWQEGEITGKHGLRIVERAKQRLVPNDLAPPPFAPPIHHTVGDAHAALYERSACCTDATSQHLQKVFGYARR